MERKNLYAALVKAQTIARAVLKDSKNDFHKYKYAAAEDIIAEARDALSQAELAFFPTAHHLVAAASETDEDKLEVEYLLVHSSGEELPVQSETPVMPEKGKPADKAVATAKTYDLGYTLRGLLLLPRVEKDASVDGRDDRNHTPRRQQPRAQAPQQSAGPKGDVWARLETAATLAGGKDALMFKIGWLPLDWPHTEEKAIEALQAAIAAHNRMTRQSKEERGSVPRPESPPPAEPPPGPAPPLRMVKEPPGEQATKSQPPAKEDATKEAERTPDGNQPATSSSAAPQGCTLSEFRRRLKPTGHSEKTAERDAMAEYGRAVGKLTNAEREEMIRFYENEPVPELPPSADEGRSR